MNPQYRRVASDENTGSSERVTTTHHSISNTTTSSSSSSSGTLVAGRSLQDRVADKAVALGWIVAALMVTYATNFYSVIFYSKEVNRTLIQLAFVGLGINSILTIYLTIYLPRVKKLQADFSAWNVYCPRVIPIMTLTGVLTALLLIRGTYPKWGFFAPLFLAIEAMGLLFSLHFFPWSC